MLREFKVRAYIGIGFGIFLTSLLFVVEPKVGTGLLVSLAGLVIAILNIILFIWGCYCYAKGKGHHGAWGLLGLLYIPGLIVLSFFRDMHKEDDKAIFETKDLNELLAMLIKREYWNKINPDIIKSIFNNAKGDVDTIKRFIFISEVCNSVRNNFVKLAKADMSFSVSMFAVTLYQLGSDFLKAMCSAKNEDEIGSLATRAEMAFTSSILCDPFCLESYFGMAALYSEISKDVSLEWCSKYKETEDKLLNTPNEELNHFQLTQKENLDPEEYRRTLRLVTEKSQCFHFDEAEIDSRPTMRDRINDLEAELLQQT